MGKTEKILLTILMLIAFLFAIGFMVLEAKGNLLGEDCGLYYNMMLTLATGILAILMPIEKWNNTNCKLILCFIIIVAIEIVTALLCFGVCSCLNILKTVLPCVLGFVFSILCSAVGKEKQDNVKKTESSESDFQVELSYSGEGLKNVNILGGKRKLDIRMKS